MPSDISQARARLGAATRYGDQQAADQARRELAAAKLEAAVAKTLATAPPLTSEQRERIVAALTPHPGGEGA
ncbi:hypothetical protein [Nesterenkonia xinjiangensis]|uniref:Uncharacterized protein n=1 Tax=Nesterenkonia xinjiangensis TaxID=225327 RepID=A0A7Z0GNC2_9MICC|nr:hypothetical protein [Nesterenkonia xinjiangensis]NYJ79184.1 hypothetical protein [Nesterenkonia xinjiangensis]